MEAENNRYILLKRLEQGPLSQFIISRLRAEGVDFKVNNNNISSVYPIDTLDMTLEVMEKDIKKARQIINEIEISHSAPNEELDFKEANHEDIEFERAMQEKESRIENAKPPILIFLLILALIGLSFYMVTF